jgi:hypothetical protein
MLEDVLGAPFDDYEDEISAFVSSSVSRVSRYWAGAETLAF